MKRVLLQVFVCCLLSTKIFAQVAQQDSMALVHLYNSASGANWLDVENWLTPGKPVPEWTGVTVTANRVTGLNIQYIPGPGSIPESIGDLTALTHLDISYYGDFSASALPETIGALSALEYLAIWYSGTEPGNTYQIGGSLPVSLGNLINLKHLKLNNYASGSIPSTLGNLSNLEVLELAGNNLTGTIPTELGNLTKLKSLILLGNKLSGNIPASLANLTQLREIYLDQNQLTGNIPEIFSGFPEFHTLSVASNQLTGPIPNSLNGLPLQTLILSDNRLSGAIPAFVCTLPLVDFSIDNNYFNFDGMPCVAGLEIDNPSYAPQKKRSLTNNNPVLSVTAGGNLANNTYTWYKENAQVHQVTGDSTYNILASGKYSVSITNNTVPGLTLYSDTVEIANVYTLLQRDSLALVDLYEKTSGPNWDAVENWLAPGKLVSEWEGVVVNNGRVTSLEVSTDQPGFIPESIGTLTALKTLRIYHFGFSGPLPNSLGNLTELEELDISMQGVLMGTDNITGSIPANIGNLTKLKKLALYGHALSGAIPALIGNLINLEELDLSGNLFTGPIPVSIVNLVNLIKLNLWGNKLSGEIPSDIGNLVNLRSIELNDNRLTGNIPNSIGNISNLEWLILDRNGLSGSIPSSIGNLNNLSVLELSNNTLSGPVPSSFCALTSNRLHTLYLNNNNFNFDGMPCIANQSLTDLNYAPQATIPLTNNNPELSVTAGGDLTNNTYTWYKENAQVHQVTGDSTYNILASGKYSVSITNNTVPGLTLYSDTVEIANVYTLLQRDSVALVDLYNSAKGATWDDNPNWLVAGKPINEWQGVTVTNGRVTNLMDIVVNDPSGFIPESIGNLTALKELTIYHFGISGTIPNSIGNLTELEYLDISVAGVLLGEENLSGPIPASIGNLTKLKKLRFEGNALSGEIPASIGNLTNLQELILAWNKLTGEIPSSIGNLTQLINFSAWFNQLSGQIPTTIGNLVNLRNLELNNNRLTGSIPASIGNITNLEWLVLNGNNLSGNIPASIGNLNNLSVLELSNNTLTGPVPAALCALTSGRLHNLYLNNNNFNFDGMPCIANQSLTDLNYAPQAVIALTNNNPELSVTAGGNLMDNAYTWFKNGTEYVTIDDDSTLTLSEPGTYYVQVRNALIPGLILTSEQVVITVVESEGTLPLDFVEVKANVCLTGACIEWKTTNEQNTSHFEVEVSVDGSTFIKTGSSVNSFNTPGIHSYQATDNNPIIGINYYRIKQVDKDGLYKYSKTVSVNISATGVIVAAPNPTTGSFILKGIDKADKVSVYNLNGQLVKQWQNIAGNKQLNIGNLSNGMYIIKIDQQHKQTIIRLLKQ